MPRSFEDLEIWKIAHKLTILIYNETNNWPDSEKFNLTSQTRRAAVSTELIIAEGHSRYTRKDLFHINYDQVKFEYHNHEYLGLIKGINGFIRALRGE